MKTFGAIPVLFPSLRLTQERYLAEVIRELGRDLTQIMRLSEGRLDQLLVVQTIGYWQNVGVLY